MEDYLKSHQWKKLYSKLNKIKGIHTTNKRRLKRFINAIIHMTKKAIPWRDLAPEYGNSHSIKQRFFYWSDKKILDVIFQELTIFDHLVQVSIDSTIVQVHPKAATLKLKTQEKEAIGRSKGGLTTKIHSLVDQKGRPLNFILSPGQSADITQAANLLKPLRAPTTILGDKGYDCDEFIKTHSAAGHEMIIPSRSNRLTPRPFDKKRYKDRNVVERFFCHIQDFRRIFSRYEKKASRFMSFLHIAAILMWLK